MKDNQLPLWLEALTGQEVEFIRQFIICSGSLKELAKRYNVSYPTVRRRLNKLIQKISSNVPEDDAHIKLIRQLALDGQMSYEAAGKLILSHRNERK